MGAWRHGLSVTRPGTCCTDIIEDMANGKCGNMRYMTDKLLVRTIVNKFLVDASLSSHSRHKDEIV